MIGCCGDRRLVIESRRRGLGGVEGCNLGVHSLRRAVGVVDEGV